MKGKLIPVAVIKLLWEKFTMKVKMQILHETFIQCLALGWYAFSHVVFVKLVRNLQLPFFDREARRYFQLKDICCFRS